MKIIYAHTQSADYVRCRKLISSLRSEGHEVLYFGVSREGSKKNSAYVEANVNNIGPGFTLPHGIRSILGLTRYLYGMRRAVVTEAPDLVIVTNEELMLALAGMEQSPPIFLDAIDSLAHRTSHGGLLLKVLVGVANWARRKADVIVEVEPFRSSEWHEFREKTIILRNTPPSAMLHIGADDFERPVKEPYIYLSGSLNSILNGVETAIIAAEQTGINLVIAGTLGDKALAELVESSPCCTFLGAVEYEHSLFLAKSSAAVFAHYKPVNWNFRNAAPNKVYEAMALGVPLLINSEARISSWAVDAGFALSSDFGADGALASLMALVVSKGVPGIGLAPIRFRQELAWEAQEKLLFSSINSLLA